MRRIKGGWQLQISGGVMHINTAEGSVLRITGLPMWLDVDHSDEAGVVIDYLIGA